MNRKFDRVCLALLLFTSACTQLVDFDRSKIPQEGSGKDAMVSGMKDAGGLDSGGSGGNRDATVDATMDSDTGTMNSCSVDGDCKDPTKPQCVNNTCEACDVANHDGCTVDKLCCALSGGPVCVSTSLASCAACGVACNAKPSDPVADACVDRQCACGTKSACNATSTAPVCYASGSATASCVECRGDTDCKASGLGQCVAGICVACDPGDNSGCSGNAPICNSQKTCEACTVAGACPGTQLCDASGACTGCANNAACTTATTPLCKTTGGVRQCVACANDTDCSGAFGSAKGQCLSTGECAACDGDSTCTTATAPLCDSADHTCKACDVSAFADRDARCDTKLPTTGVCAVADTRKGQCVECDSDSDCGDATKPLCDTATNTCKACTGAGITNADNRCEAKVPGAGVGACVTSGSKVGHCEACDPADHGGCAASELCCEAGAQNTPTCESTSAGTQCAACDTACSASAANSCGNRTCQCGSGAICSGVNDICVGSPGSCVDCDSDDDCTSATAPLCNPATNTCVPCNTVGLTNADARCDAETSGTAVCATSGSKVGQCAACDPTDHAGCGTSQLCCEAGAGNTPTCESTSAGTQCSACDTACGTNADSCDGRTCECGTGVAAAACANSTPYCSTGVCVGCRGDGDCSAPNDQCEAGRKVCVNCDATGGCASGEQCRTSDATCVDCIDNGGCSNDTVCKDGDVVCVQCNVKADCANNAGTPECRSDGACVACIDNATTPCAANRACLSNACVPCVDDASCTGRVGATQCVDTDPGAGTSFECRACDPAGNAPCSGTTPICGATFTCEKCSSDTQCGGLTPYCLPTGACAAETGACSPANGNADCQLDLLHPVCSAPAGNFCRAS